MSLKTWAKAPRPKTEEVNEFWAKNGGPPATANSLGDSDGGASSFVGPSCSPLSPPSVCVGRPCYPARSSPCLPMSL